MLIAIILLIVTLSFASDLILQFLNLKSRTQPIPQFLAHIYDEETYEKQQQYGKENAQFSLLVSTVSFVLLVLVLIFGIFGKLHAYIALYNFGEVANALIFFFTIFLASRLLSLPAELWATFTIEAKYGFNRTTPGLFIADRLKSFLISVVIGGGILILILVLFRIYPRHFWLFALGAMLIFSLLANALYSTIFVPLFNKQTPLPQGELFEAIAALGDRVNFSLTQIFVIDGSKRSTKANAYFTGFGKRRRVVLYDTLISSLEVSEIVAVLAHEIGHYRKRHIWKNFALSSLQMALILFIFNQFAHSLRLSEVLGYPQATEPVFHLNLIAFSILISPLNQFLGIFSNMASRHMEFEADRFAVETGKGNSLVGALKALAKNSLTNLTPHPAYVFMYYSHPALLQRVKKILDCHAHPFKK